MRESTVVVGRPVAEPVRDAAARLLVDLRHRPRIDAAAVVVLPPVHREPMRRTLRAPGARVRRMPGPARVDHVREVEEAR